MRGILAISILACMLGFSACPQGGGGGATRTEPAVGSTPDAGHATAETPTAAADTVPDPAHDEPAANPCETGSADTAPADGLGLPMRGVARREGEGLRFLPCDSPLLLDLVDGSGELEGLIDEFGSDLYVQFSGLANGNVVELSRLWRAASVNETIGCREDQSGLLFLMRGNEPFWGAEVRESRVIALLRPADDGSGISERLFDIVEDEALDSGRLFIASAQEDGTTLELRLTESPCRDSMAEDWFGMQARLSVGGSEFSGCAWPGEARVFGAEQ